MDALMMAGAQKAKLPTGSILDPEYHARLISSLPDVARTAGIPQHMIHRSMKDYLSADELKWFVNIRQNMQKWAGACFVGEHEPSINTKMMAICAALLRNFMDARVVTMAGLITATEAGDSLDATVLLVPNFSVDLEGGKPYTAWQMSAVHDVLVERMAAGLPTILYARSMESLRKHYGEELEKFIAEHWALLEG